jgi:hypothetical protein
VTAAAQEPRFTVGFNAGVQAAMPTAGEQFEFFRPVDLAEAASADVRYRSDPALLLDGGVWYRFARRLSAGVAITRFSGSGRAEIDALVPHPFVFNTPRDVSGEAPDLDHVELGYHVQLQYSWPLTRSLRLVLAAGPTFFDVRRDIVESVAVDESFPFDSATFRFATPREATGTAVGFNAGADVVWMFARRAGLGGMVRYARGSADLEGPSRSTTVDVGGLQTGAGIRYYF